MTSKNEKKAEKKTTRRRIQAYAFIDTNIFLDFYRARSEASLSLLEKLEKVRDRVISTYQIEMEFLKNRQNQICNIANESKLQIQASLPTVLSDTQLSESVKRIKSEVRSKQIQLKKSLLRLLQSPGGDRVYAVLESIFRSESEHVLTRDMDIKDTIKKLAKRRFDLGYPPRKSKDTSMGDAVNWEWIIHCARS